jgi:hypothetical protein
VLTLVAAAVLAALAAVLWFVLVRPVPEETAAATIMAKTLRAAGTYTQQMVGSDRAFRVPTEIPVAEAYVLKLAVDGMARPVQVSLNTVQGRGLEAGQRVQVRYIRRTFRPFWRRVIVVEVSPLGEP